jgi:stalled ribosome rescue protein Dom34
MSTFHTAAWMDHSEAHVVMFDREHMEARRIRSRSHHKHQGKATDNAVFFADIATALAGTHAVLLAGPGLMRTQFRDWCNSHPGGVARVIVDSLPADHPTDGQLVAMARQYFRTFDAMAADPSTA